ncbi:hypothetical protein B9Z39_15800 [Limnohabitans sp. JirII-29]|uniref:hypothetical protein n=1 Tax=Limnohabitans sp. JirII-29 TaxID=1835756 RepID=UPI000DD2A706|nr:hypothetical protein [Limnohabitans sp. JirII-29]PUE23215.1 hypothetical protein B9Z39_15800 [Limnohabitans sp. JirII-29]
MKTLKLWLMCLLVLAVPLQGMAAVSQMFCHGQAAVVVAHVVMQTPPAQVHLDAHHGHHGHDAHAVAQHVPTSHDASSAQANANANTNASATPHHTCSTCAQCCVGMALLPAPVVLALGQPAHTLVAAPAVLLGEWSPNHLERPPRTFLA